MSAALPDVWAERDFPILVEACRAIDAGDGIGSPQLADTLGFSTDTVARGLKALERKGLITCEWTMSDDAYLSEVSGRAYELVGLHPHGSDGVELLMDALTKAAEHANNQEERTALRDAKRSFANISGQVAANIMAAVITAAARM